MRAHPVPVVLAASVLAAGLLVPASGSAHAPAADGGADLGGPADGPGVVLTWQENSFQAVYPLPSSSIPAGVPVLGFTSVTMYRAIRHSLRRDDSSETAAAATAAHDVLVSYAPRLHDSTTAATVVSTLHDRLAATLGSVPDGAAKTRGAAIGARVAGDFLESREGDHFRDPTIHYAKPLLPGYWQPTAPRTDMLEAWLGSLDHLVLRRLVTGNGPDALRSGDYARDYNEVKRYGAAGSTWRQESETQTSYFFNANSATTVGRALATYLGTHPMGIRDTGRIFAVMHAAMTDAIISCWELKRDVGFWRPREAIAGALADQNPATTPEAGWTPLLPEPPYSDYVSGHGCLTAPATETIRILLGEDTPLRLVSTNPLATVKERDYAYLSDIETDALNSRIWGGLHFRDAMEDAYDIGRTTARKVERELP